MHFHDLFKYFKIIIIVRIASTKRKNHKGIIHKSDRKFEFLFWFHHGIAEIIQLESIFTSPSQNILLRACMTLWSLLFTRPLRSLRIDAPQSELIIFTLIPYSVLSDITPLWQFPLQIYSHHVINTSQGGWEQDRKNDLRCLIALNLWWFCMLSALAMTGSGMLPLSMACGCGKRQVMTA